MVKTFKVRWVGGGGYRRGTEEFELSALGHLRSQPRSAYKEMLSKRNLNKGFILKALPRLWKPPERNTRGKKKTGF